MSFTPAQLTSRRSVSAALRDHAVALAERVATPLMPADYLDLIRPLRAGADLRARIVAIGAETSDAVTVSLAPGRGWTGHTPGQYVRIGVDVDGVRRWRAYSLTSPPRADGTITITVKAIPDGVVSNYLVRRARPGTIVQLEPACGAFTLPDPMPSKVLFVTAGSGITPVMGMLRGARGRLRDVVLVHSAPTESDAIFLSELRALAAHGHIRLVLRRTRADGKLDATSLLAAVPDLAERETWACGPEGLLDTVEERFAALGRSARLRVERFRPTLLATGEGGRVTFTRSGTVVEADGATPLLDVGEAAGMLMPSGCRMGICFSCVVPLREGAVRDLRSGDLTTAAPGDGVIIQTCVSAAAGPCHIEL
jgi:ferredoxin-NADP reductase